MQSTLFNRKHWTQLAVILTGVFIIYSPALDKEFVNYDDPFYIYENPFFHPFLLSNIGKIFSEFYGGQYSPLPMTFIGLLNIFSGNETFLYNLFAVLLHLINVCLVCWLVFRLGKNPVTALTAALLFAVCTINVEAVAWASAIFKIGFYSIFFLASLISYTFYLSSNKFKYLAASFVFFVLSFLSKEQAIVLVLSLLCIDFLFKRNLFSRKVILEKLPFLIFGAAFGIITVLAAKSYQAEFVINHFTVPQRILYACYAVGEYLVKLFVPYGMSAYYQYPDSKTFSVWFYLHPLILAGLIFLFIRTVKKNRTIAFGILFFAANLLFTLVLQVISVRGIVMADRYVYLSSIGIFYAAAEGYIFLRNNKLKIISLILLSGFTAVLSINTYARCGVWKNSLTLWNDVISKDKTITYAYYNRGHYLMNHKKNDEAISDFSKAVELNHRYDQAYCNRANLLKEEGKFDEAMKDYDKAILINPKLHEAYINRAMLLQSKHRNEDALKDFNAAIELKPNLPEAYNNRGILLQNEKRNEEALKDFNKAIELNPNSANAYINRGLLFSSEKKINEASSDFNRAIEIEHNSSSAYYNRAVFEFYSGQKDKACADFQHAAHLGYKPAEEAFRQASCH